MSKARKAALDWMPERKDGRKRCYRCNDDDVRGIFARGYRKAEKDLELGWEDLATIEKLGDDFFKQNPTPMSDEEFYKEVLKRFNDYKERKKV